MIGADGGDGRLSPRLRLNIHLRLEALIGLLHAPFRVHRRRWQPFRGAGDNVTTNHRHSRRGLTQPHQVHP